MADPPTQVIRDRVALEKELNPSGGGTMLVSFHASASAETIWTDQPAAATFFLGSHRHVILADLSDFTEARFVVNMQGVGGETGALLELRYKAGAFSATEADYTIVGTGASAGIDTTNTVVDSGWVTMADGARDVVHLAVIGTGGDGVTDPSFGAIVAMFK